MKRKYLYFHQFCYFHFLLYSLLAVTVSCQDKPDSHFSKSAKKALSTFELAPGFQIELVAAEPLIADPVDMVIDENGRMYVVEMHGYPLDKSGTGKIKLLIDADGDGQMDKSTVFADGLMLPTGVMRWKEGILVTDAPNVLYLEDTDGDGQADIRDTLLTGFALSNPQHNLNNPLLGLDNWIYLAHEPAVATQAYKEEFGDQGGDIFYPGRPEGPHLPNNANGRNVRFRPDSYDLEMTSATTQFGHTFDPWGHHLLVTNSNHIFQEVIAARYLQRNPDLLVSNATQSLSDHGNAAEVFPITENPEHQLLTNVGVFTSATGLTMYQGGAFPVGFDSVTFVAEPVSNLVHADRLTDEGTSFTASRLYSQKEFLASTDAWFRPVNMYIGPDGALYVIDYYRKIIEHPEWMAEEVVQSGELYNGTDQGRIYRITPTGTKPATWTKDLHLGNASIEQLVEKLAHPNIWWRRNAQRLLLDRSNKEAVPLLKQMAQNTDSPLGRLHALWTLEGLGKLSPEMIRQALKDPVPGIRENAIKLAELHLNDAPALTNALLALQEDTDPKVRFQLLLTLGFMDTPSIAQARQNLLFEDLQDEWVQIAALSATSLQENILLNAVLDRFQKDIPAYASLVQRLSAMVGVSGQSENIHQLLEEATVRISEEFAWQAPVLEGLAQGLKSRKLSSSDFQVEQNSLVRAFFEHPSALVRQASLQVLQVTGLADNSRTQTALRQTQKMAGNQDLPAERRAEAIHFLALGSPDRHSSLLTKLIAPGEPLPVQLAALQTLSSIPDRTVSQYVLEHWEVLTPEVRDAALNTFLANPDRIKLLLNAIEAGRIQQTSLGWSFSVRLMTQGNEAIKSRARSLLAGKDDDQRQEMVQQYQPSLEMAGNPVQGKQIFQQNCAVCHQMGGAIGMPFGPDLATIRNRRPASILSDIIDPNQSIADGYDLWTVTLKNGESVQGVISAETPTAITLRNVGGQETTIARQDIQLLKALGMSAMPANLEKQISEQEMADLLAYIKQVK